MEPKMETKKTPINARGRFFSSQELVDAINDLFGQGLPITKIALATRTNYRTVRKILGLRKSEIEHTRPAILENADIRYVIVASSGVPHSVPVESLDIYHKMSKPWIHGAPLSGSRISDVRYRMNVMANDYGKVKLARIVYVDPVTLQDLPFEKHEES